MLSLIKIREGQHRFRSRYYIKMYCSEFRIRGIGISQGVVWETLLSCTNSHRNQGYLGASRTNTLLSSTQSRFYIGTISIFFSCINKIIVNCHRQTLKSLLGCRLLNTKSLLFENQKMRSQFTIRPQRNSLMKPVAPTIFHPRRHFGSVWRNK